EIPNFGFYLNGEKIIALVKTYYWLLGIVVGFFGYKLTNYLVLSYPYYVRNRRKSEIDLYLPHAVNMMYGMAVGGLNPIDIFREISKLEHLFGELSVEFKEIVKNFDVFKQDFFTSLRMVRDTTPSEKLSAFLDSLILVLQGGGKFSTYLKSKSEEYEEEKEIVFGEVMSFMEILFEIYISIFMLFPLLLLIVLVVSKMVSSEIMWGYSNLIYLILPVSTAFIIYLARSAIPLPKITIKHVFEEVPLIKVNVSGEERRFKVLRIKKLLKKIVSFILHPYRTSLVFLNVRIVVVHLVLYSAIALLLLQRLGVVMSEHYVLLIFLALLLVTFIVELKNKILRRAEEMLPEFFKELAMLNESGVSIFEGIKLVAKSEVGVLSKEFEGISRSVELGEPITKSLSKLVVRIKSDIFAKAVPIAVKALETSTSIKDAFITVSRYVEAELSFRKRLKSNLMPYVAIIYLTVVVFLFVAYLLISKFLVTFSGMSVSFMGIQTTFDVDLIKETFMKTILLVSTLSGIIAGAIAEMNVGSGLKHVLALTAMSYAAFKFLIV
ncbi:type II secretion system F family protein, partial [Ferroglobus sp.]|uniref:type II secretion system F family protein n=1 Tax=Ferroglobus sp. TaxID=2614230 RepID=UPI0025C28731